MNETLTALARYAEDSKTWRHGEKTEDELLQRIWNLAADTSALTRELEQARDRLGRQEGTIKRIRGERDALREREAQREAWWAEKHLAEQQAAMRVVERAEAREAQAVEALEAGMSDPISIPALRERLARAKEFPPSWADESPSPSEAAALIEAVEALEDVRDELRSRAASGDIGSWTAECMAQQADRALARLREGSPAEECEHEWVSARNTVVLSGEICRKCHALRAESYSEGSPEGDA